VTVDPADCRRRPAAGVTTYLAAALFLFSASPAEAQVGALQTDCRLGGPQAPESYQFVVTCAGRSRSPDGRFAVVQRAYRERQPPIEFQDGRGRRLMLLHSLTDDMPFSVHWAPNSRWFFVNHHVGSFMHSLRLFQIVGRRAVERPALARSAVRIATRRYPCLRPDWVNPSGVRWSRDSRRILLVTISASYACSPEFGARPGSWQPLWMIGEVRSGRIVPGSIRVDRGNEGLRMPTDGPYRPFRRSGS
jgi:hypothetical protein